MSCVICVPEKNMHKPPVETGVGASQVDAPTLSSAVARLRLRHFQILDALDQFGSLRRAALTLGITQSAATTLIDDLEFAFGTPLVVRGHSGTTLTPAALTVLARGQIAVQEITTARRLIARGDYGSGHLRIGSSPYLISTLIPGILASLHKSALFRIRTDVREGTLDVLVAELSQGKLDAVLTSVDHAAVLSSGASLDIVPLAREHMCVVAGRGHPLFGSSQPNLGQVLAGPWVLPHTTSHVRALVDSAVFETGSPPIVPQVECRGISNLLLIATTSELLTVSPLYEVSRAHWQDNISLIPNILPFKATPYVLITRRHVSQTMELTAFCEQARFVANQLFNPMPAL